MFTNNTQGRVDTARALRQDVQEAMETYDAEVLSPTELAKVRATSAHGRRGTSQAVSVADQTASRVTLRSV